MKTKHLITLSWTLAVLALLSGVSHIQANETRRFNNPMHQNYRLDWCLEWAKQCGEPAASAWCQARGYQRAESHQIAQDIGDVSPTQVYRTGQICKDKFCDGFSFIVCERADKPAPPVKPMDGFTRSWQKTDSNSLSEYRDDRPGRVSRDEFKQPGLLIGKLKPILIRPVLDPEGWIQRGLEQLSDFTTPEPQRKINARASFDRAMEVAKRTGNRDKLRGTALQIVDVYLRHQMAGEAKGYLNQAIQAYREAGDTPGLARTLLKIASLYANSWHDPDENFAEQSARNALSLYQKFGDEPGQASAIQQLGYIALRRDKPPQALEHFQKAFEIRRQIGDRGGQAQSLLGIAASYEKMARRKLSGLPDLSQPIYDNLAMSERALKTLREALLIIRETGDQAGAWRALFNLGAIHENRGEEERAVAYYQEALDTSTAANQRNEAESQLACDTDLGHRLSNQFRNKNIQCPMAAFGSTALLFDDEEAWDE